MLSYCTYQIYNIKMNKLLIFSNLCTAFSLMDLVASAPSKGNKIIYILLDGFRYDYVDDQPPEDIPGFSKFLENGVRAEYMAPIFPSISYPDWTTLVTGLWAESHGIVGNSFYDAETQDIFTLVDSDSTGKKKWWTAEPIWTTATKSNKRTAVFSWSRCDVPFDEITPDYCEEFRVDKRGIDLFKANAKKALLKLGQGFDLIQLYTDHADSVGHRFGPETEERREAVRQIDSVIMDMQDEIEEMGMTDQVNIIIVSDHGMTTTGPGSVNRVELDDYLLTEYVENVSGGVAYANIKVKNGFLDKVYDKLKEMPGVTAFKHSEIPDDLHYKNNKYIHDILLIADTKTFIMKSRADIQLPPRDDSFVYYGAHGFDPREEKMWAIFFATGPDFKNGSHKIPHIQNVDVYPLLAHLLGVKPQPNNGTLDTIKMALRHEDDISASSSVTVKTGALTSFICFIYLYAALR